MTGEQHFQLHIPDRFFVDQEKTAFLPVMTALEKGGVVCIEQRSVVERGPVQTVGRAVGEDNFRQHGVFVCVVTDGIDCAAFAADPDGHGLGLIQFQRGNGRARTIHPERSAVRENGGSFQLPGATDPVHFASAASTILPNFSQRS